MLLCALSSAAAAVYDSTLNFRNNETPTLLGILNGKKYHADLYVRYKEMFCREDCYSSFPVYWCNLCLSERSDFPSCLQENPSGFDPRRRSRVCCLAPQTLPGKGSSVLKVSVAYRGHRGPFKADTSPDTDGLNSSHTLATKYVAFTVCFSYFPLKVHDWFHKCWLDFSKGEVSFKLSTIKDYRRPWILSLFGGCGLNLWLFTLHGL